jgi:DNA-binding MarR family transcriptional regulator
MGMIVLPYLGRGAAGRELTRPVPAPNPERAAGAAGGGHPLEGLNMRLTYRTLRVLAAIGAHPGLSNRGVADTAEIADQGQVSKLLARLQDLGLIENTGEGHSKGAPNAWRLTPRGGQVAQAM